MRRYVNRELVEDMMRGLPFGYLAPSKCRDPYFAADYNRYVTFALNGANYTIVIFYEHKEEGNKNKLHIIICSSKLGIDKSFDVEKYRYRDHKKLMKLMKKVLLS